MKESKLLKKKTEYVPVSGIIGDACDYNIYKETVAEKIRWFLLGAVVSGAVLYVFYESIIITLIAGIICGIVFIPIHRKSVIEKRKLRLSVQFKSLLEALSTSIGAGKNVRDSFFGAKEDLSVQYSEDSDIVKEINIINIGLENNVRIEELLMNFAKRSGLEDIKSFADVFATCYKKGGNINEIIKNTSKIIGDKIEIKMELETMVSGQKNEQNIMLVMPVIFIIVLKSMGGELVDLTSVVGRLSITGSLLIFVAAYFISKKILDIKL